MADDWQEAVASGRARREAETSAEERAQQEKRRVWLARNRRFAFRSASPLWASLERVIWSCATGATVAVTLAFVGRCSWNAAIGASLALGLVPVALLLLARRDGPRRFAREQEWAAGLPFPLEHYLFFLGYYEDHPRLRVRTATVRVELADAARLDEAADACRGLAPSLQLRRRDDRLEFTAAVLRNDGSNHPYLRWMHQLVDQALRPLAAHHPIVRVSLDASHFEDWQLERLS
jgi:hypothetical protein